MDWETMPDDEVLRYLKLMLRTYGLKDDYRWFCKRLGLPISGTNAELKERLELHLQNLSR